MYLKQIRDKDISRIIGNILRWGVYLSLSIAFIGGLIYLWGKGGAYSQVQHQLFVEKDANLIELLSATFKGVSNGLGGSIIELGILLLMATPLARVVFSLVAFYLEKDKLYVFITLMVLLIIFTSILTGFGG